MNIWDHSQPIENYVTYEDFLKETGLGDKEAYQIMMENEHRHIRYEDGDFYYRVDFTKDKDSISTLLQYSLSYEMIKRNKFAISYCQ